MVARPSQQPYRASQTVASLLPATTLHDDLQHQRNNSSLVTGIWSTGSKSIDGLLGYTPSSSIERDSVAKDNAGGVDQDVPIKEGPCKKGKEAHSGVKQGMVLEVASPPGGGKSSLVVGVAVRARLDGDGEIEVLLVGESVRDSSWCKPSFFRL